MTEIETVFSGANGRRFATNEALKEIYRVLIPGGNLGMIWNVEDCTISITLLSSRKADHLKITHLDHGSQGQYGKPR